MNNSRPQLSDNKQFATFDGDMAEFAIRIISDGMFGYIAKPIRQLGEYPLESTKAFYREKNSRGSAWVKINEDLGDQDAIEGDFIARFKSTNDEPTSQIMLSQLLPVWEYGVKGMVDQALLSRRFRFATKSELHRIYDLFGELSLSTIHQDIDGLQRLVDLNRNTASILQENAIDLFQLWDKIRVMMVNGCSFDEADRFASYLSASSDLSVGASALKYLSQNAIPFTDQAGLLFASGLTNQLDVEPKRIVADYLSSFLLSRGEAGAPLPTLSQATSLALRIPAEVAEKHILDILGDEQADIRIFGREEQISIGKPFEIDRDISEGVADRHETSPFGVKYNDISKEILIRGKMEPLSQEQISAIYLCLSQKMSIITGGPGTGKSTTIQAMVSEIIKSDTGGRIILTAPTSKAAKKLSDLTGLPCVTLHRLLGLAPNSESMLSGFGERDTLIFDECSMVDLTLFARTLKNTKSNGRVIVCGDKNQLASIEAGAILDDLEKSRFVPVAELTSVRRTSQESNIVRGAYCIQNGSLPNFKAENSDLHLAECKNDEDIIDAIRTAALRARDDLKIELEEIQILGAMRKGVAGINAINAALKDVFNPGFSNKPNVWLGGIQYFEGDRVRYLRNDYDKDLQNGMIGNIEQVNKQKKELLINFEGRLMTVPFAGHLRFTHSIASTVHSSQGSEYKFVILAMPSDHAFALTRKLVLTAITRGKQEVWIAGSKSTIYKAANNTKEKDRKSHIPYLVAEYVSSRIDNKLFQNLGLSVKKHTNQLTGGRLKDNNYAPS